MISCKTPSGESGSAPTVWHQDLAFVPHDRAGHVNLWIALNEVTPDRGALRFLDESQREGAVGGITVDLKEERPDLFEKYELSPPLHLQPGDATIHGSYTIHGAPGNETEIPRWAFLLSYFPSDVRYTGTPDKYGHEEMGFEIGDRIDHPTFRVVYPEGA